MALTPAELLLRLVLTGTQSHYEFRGVIDDKRLEHLLLAGKQILYKSHQESDVRQALGFSPRVWSGLTSVLAMAIPVLESLSFAWKAGNATGGAAVAGQAGYTNNGSSSDLIAANYLGLVKDIERLNDLCTIARNLLATTKRAQNLAAEKGFDQQILRLIDVCVRVTARGFDGEGVNVRSEERWGKVVNLYKRLLITCLQFLHNFIMHNEQRKLVLWLDLFGNATQQQREQAEAEAQRQAERALGVGHEEGQDQVDVQTASRTELEHADVQERIKAAMEKLPQIAEGGLGYNIDDVHALFEMMSTSKEPDNNTQETAKVLMEKIRSDMEKLSGLNSNQLDGDPEALLRVGAALRARMPNKELPPPVEQAVRNAVASVQRGARQFNNLPDLSSYADITGASQEITEADYQMPRTAESAAETLQEAKDELMARLQEPSHVSEDAPYDDEDGATASHVLEDSILDSAEDDLSEVESERSASAQSQSETSSYQHPNDQERGLLTDVPLVLGPTEIEALPMIIQAGIVDNFGNTSKPLPPQTVAERQNIRNMQSVRCHILLAQEAGRNVLRELLIFIAAWDLPDDEFYFKMMVQIMEAILKNGLMSHAYADFGQAKDIISPAQAVVVKILTHIYRTRYSPTNTQNQKENNRDAAPREPVEQSRAHPVKALSPLTRVDVLTVRYIFTVFRGNIVPETCALIYLQGQIRQGLAIAEDFPLNLWDMERVYEGVYQFLEFFAVLTENNEWKKLLVNWEIVYDLCTLIKELEAAIPKVNPLTAGKTVVRDSERDVGVVYTGEAADMAPPPVPPPAADATATILPQASEKGTPPVAVAVERPYSLSPPPPTNSPVDPLSSPSPPPPPITGEAASPTAAAASAAPGTTTAPLEDPSTFEWRNLKKLIILVLSSLVWKSRLVQDQIRAHGGVDTVLSCTVHDANNPYIREHAVMCLKFLLEGNEENQRLVADLEARGVKDAYKDEGQGGVGGFEGGGRAFEAGFGGGGKGKRRAVSEGEVVSGGVKGSGTGDGVMDLAPVDARRVRERFGELSFGEVDGGTLEMGGPGAAGKGKGRAVGTPAPAPAAASGALHPRFAAYMGERMGDDDIASRIEEVD